MLRNKQYSAELDNHIMDCSLCGAVKTLALGTFVSI